MQLDNYISLYHAYNIQLSADGEYQYDAVQIGPRVANCNYVYFKIPILKLSVHVHPSHRFIGTKDNRSCHRRQVLSQSINRSTAVTA